ncbi:MAG: TonB-dependent receptor [Novosphingobium sp.]|nr:TonB-dependent receptor [Novosphingobium sp.]
MALFVSSAPVLAQDDKGAADNSTDEILVTAQFRQQNVQKTPLAITAVSGDMLDARSQTSIADIANQAPSVTLKPQGASFGPSLTANIRGVGQYDFNPAFEPGVGMYVDDVYYPTLTGSILDLLDVDRVEILRGPQGTLAGKNSIGGAVKMYSKRPTGSNSGFISGTYGSRDRIDLRGAVDFALTDTVSARLSGVMKRQGGYITNYDFGCLYPAGGSATFVNGDGVTLPVNPAGGIPALVPAFKNCVRSMEGDKDYKALRGQLRFQPNDRLDINIIGDFTKEDHRSAGAVLLDRSVNGVRVSPNFVDRPSTSPYGATDINPYGGNIPYDNRFLCGPYCNFASYLAPADYSSGPGGAFANTGGVRQATAFDGMLDYSGWGVSGQLEYELNDSMTLNSISAYRSYHTTFDNDDDLSPLAHTNNTNDLRFWMASEELRLSGKLFDDAVNYTLGGFYLTQKSVNAAIVDIRYSGLPLFANDDVTKAKTAAAFAHVSWQVTPELSFNAGLRYTNEYKAYTFSRRSPDGSPLPAGTSIAVLDGRTGIYDGPESTRWDYRLNAQYEITPDISIYGQVSTGFKGGGISPRPFNDRQVLSFGPETLTSYELGWKSELFDRKVRLNIATYLSKYSNIQLALTNCTAIVGDGYGVPCSLTVNAGNADIKGFEVETTVRPVKGLLVDGSVSFVDFDYKKFATYGSATVGGPGNPNGPQFGDYPVYTPRWKWAVGAQYTADLGSAGTLTPRIDLSYQGKVYGAAANRSTNLIDAYTMANARLTWANPDSDLEISLEVTNLFDKYYLLTVMDFVSQGAGLVSGQPGRPREWAVTVKKSF